ncbi:LysR substrate-binding domain-containing protein [Robbsia sp. KACC 23696]|uniref:LysR family transcriptional regulator n=1 Tax=Robbsia sp. KACC 23696 TaxID=3149231 RepID=UPI00325AD9FD
MELQQLRQFVEVARLGSVSKAATQLGLSQSYLSQRIGALEGELKRHLFLRHGRGVTLTDAGQRWYDAAVDILQRLDAASEALVDDDRYVTGRIVVGLPPSMILRLSVQVIRAFTARFPNAKLRLIEEMSGSLQTALLENRVDVAFLFNPVLDGTLETTMLSREPICLITRRETVDDLRPQGSPSERDTPNIPLSALADIPLILPAHPHPLRTMIENAAASRGVALNIPYEVEGVDTIVHLVQEGIASTISTAHIMRPSTHALAEGQTADGHAAAPVDAEELIACRIVDPDLSSTLFLAVSAKRASTVLLERTVQLMKEIAGVAG